MKQKRPEHCYMCPHHHKAGHKKGTAFHNSKFDNWCCKYSTAAPKAVSVCLAQNGKPSNAKVRGDAPLYGAASLSTDGLCNGG